MKRTNMWAKRAHLRDTRDSGDMKSERILGTGVITIISAEENFKIFLKIYNTYCYPNVNSNLISVG